VSERKHPKDMRLSDAGADVIADREGMRLEAYHDERDILTIGIGHTSAAGPPEVYEGMVITEKQAWQIFRDDNARFRQEVLHLVKAPVHQHELDALASFIFNIGSTQFAGSTVLKRLNAGDYEGIPDAMMMWVKPSSLVSRRQGEAHDFEHGQPYQARIL
jgi:lysozyme